MFSQEEIYDFLQEEQTFSVETYQDAYGILATGDMHDEQEWLDHRILSYPMSECSYIPEKTIVRKSGRLASTWSDADLEAMTKEVYTSPRVLEIEPTKEIDKPQEIISGHTRVQVTYYINSQYQKGHSGNFELRQDMDKVFNSLQFLLTIFPKTKRPETTVRVQLQNKDKNKMRGGKNFSLHNADLNRVLTILQETFTDFGWIKDELSGNSGQLKPELSKNIGTLDQLLENIETLNTPITKIGENIQCGLSHNPKTPELEPCLADTGSPVGKVLNNIEKSQEKTINFSTEDGSRKPGKSLSFLGHRGSTDNSTNFSQKCVQKQRDRRDWRVIESEKEILNLIGVK